MRVLRKVLLAAAGSAEVALLFSLIAFSGRPALAQTPGSAAGTPQTWQVQVSHAGPEGHNWEFNAYYPKRLQAHAGDTINFTIAAAPDEYHTVTLGQARTTPDTIYNGQAGGFAYPNSAAGGGLQRGIFINEPQIACGRADQTPCSFDGTKGINSGVLVRPPADSGGKGNLTFTATLASGINAGTYYFLCLVHGPAMSGSFDVLPAATPARSAATLQADAQRAYESDLQSLAEDARSIATPSVTVNRDSSFSWDIAAGAGTADGRLDVNEFGVNGLFIKTGDSVTWHVSSGIGDQHTITGFGTQPGQPPARLPVYQPACSGMNGDTLPAPGSYGPDIWNSCPGSEQLLLTRYAFPSAPSGGSYQSGTSLTSGILMSAVQLATPVEQGSPFTDSYTTIFPDPGTYRYVCEIHPGMAAYIVVQAP